MLGVIVSGRLVSEVTNCHYFTSYYMLEINSLLILTLYYVFGQVQTDFQQIDENKFLLNIPDADNINHVVVFLTGAVPLPAGAAGAGKKQPKTTYSKFLNCRKTIFQFILVGQIQMHHHNGNIWVIYQIRNHQQCLKYHN